MNSNPNDDAPGMLLVEAVEALRSSWSTGESSIGSIGSQLRGATRLPSLLQLVLIDSELAMKAGHPCNVVQYINIFPELAPHYSLIEQHIRALRIKSEKLSPESSPGMFSKASLDQTLDHASQNDAESKPEFPTHSPESAEEKLPEFIGRYRILRLLGEGSFGKVLLAEDPRLGRKVAIKIQDRKNSDLGLSDAFLHEARAISRLAHPNIVRLLHVDETAEGLGYLVYEYVAGETLEARVKLVNYSIEEVIGWIAAIARALDFAHRRGVVHRDISPRNIMIDDQGNAKLLDFGLSRLDDRFHVADDNRLLGTPNFMSPEQASGKPHWATSYADIFSLGSVLYYALGGKLPFPGNSIFDVCERIQFSSPPPLRSLRDGIPGELEAVVQKAMAKEPQARFATGADFAEAIEKAINTQYGKNNERRPSVLREYIVPGIALVLLIAGFGLLVHAWNTYRSQLPKSEITEAKLVVKRSGNNSNILTSEYKDILPLKADDVISINWSRDNHLTDVKQTFVLILGEDKEDFKVILGPGNSQRIDRHLFRGNSLVLACLSQSILSESSFTSLGSPWEELSDEARSIPVVTHYRANNQFLSKLPPELTQLAETGIKTIELNKTFEQGLIDLGVSAYFGVVLYRE